MFFPKQKLSLIYLIQSLFLFLVCEADDRPNIILIIIDQQRWDILDKTITPNLYELSKKGVQFDQSFTVQPLCTPSRAALMTGLYGTQSGVNYNRDLLPRNSTTIARLLGENGYRTGYVGKFHLGSADPVIREERLGFDQHWRAANVPECEDAMNCYVYDENNDPVTWNDKHRIYEFTDLAIEFIEQEEDQPFFLTIGHYDPHHQNSDDRIQCPPDICDLFASNYSSYLPNDLKYLENDYTKIEFKHYLSSSYAIDQGLGEIMKTLGKKNIVNNTLIIYTSDHGNAFDTREEGGYKRSPFDASSRVPLILHGDKFLHHNNNNNNNNNNKGSDSIVLSIDVTATILYAGLSDRMDVTKLLEEKNIQGRPLQKLLDLSWEGRKYGLIQYNQQHRFVGRGLRTKDYLYAIQYDGTDVKMEGSNKYQKKFFFNQKSDESQLINLLNVEHLDTKFLTSELNEKLKQLMNDINEPGYRLISI